MYGFARNIESMQFYRLLLVSVYHNVSLSNAKAFNFSNFIYTTKTQITKSDDEVQNNMQTKIHRFLGAEDETDKAKTYSDFILPNCRLVKVLLYRMKIDGQYVDYILYSHRDFREEGYSVLRIQAKVELQPLPFTKTFIYTTKFGFNKST